MLATGEPSVDSGNQLSDKLTHGSECGEMVTGTESKNAPDSDRGTGLLLQDAHYQHRDIRLLGRAVNEGWEVRPDMLKSLPDAMYDIAMNAKEETPQRVNAARVVVMMHESNIKATAPRPASPGKVDVTVNIANVTSDQPARTALAEAARVLRAIPAPE
jgi:hypothetical protein